MAAENSARTAQTEIAATIERRIAQRTWGRLRQLRVEVTADRVIVHGCAPSYYVKQLAVVAVGEALVTMPVELQIDVGASDPGTTPRRPGAW